MPYKKKKSQNEDKMEQENSDSDSSDGAFEDEANDYTPNEVSKGGFYFDHV